MKSTITLKQVAERAGCSVNAVSTVLNGARGKTGVSETLREKILLTADEMGYRPNLMARHMKQRQSRIVGVLVRNNSRVRGEEWGAHPLAWEIVLGINEGLEEAGYMMSLVRLSDVDPEKHFQASAFQGHLLDGLIVVNDVPAASHERLQNLVPHCVWVDNNYWTPTHCIRRDEIHAGRTVAQRMAQLGFRKLIIANLGPKNFDAPEHHYSFSFRLRGLCEAARAANLEIERLALPWNNGELARALAAFARSLPDARCAVVALDIYTAQTLASSLLSEGICAGFDFSLACCDDHFRGGGLDWHQLSRVGFNRFQMGYQAAHMMLEQLAHPENAPVSQLLQGEWIKGATALPRDATLPRKTLLE